MSPVIESQFYAPRLPVNIVALPNAYEAQAMRALIEMLGGVVTIHLIGTPGDFLTVLGQGETAPRYLLIAGHGDVEEGFWLDRYADFIDTSMLRGEYLPAEAIAPVVDLPGCTVIATSCGGGSAAMGRAFTQNGRIHAYIGSRVHTGGEITVFVVNFFFNVMVKKMADRDAWRRAMVATDHPAIYQTSLYWPGGREERYEEGEARVRLET